MSLPEEGSEEVVGIGTLLLEMQVRKRRSASCAAAAAIVGEP